MNLRAYVQLLQHSVITRGPLPAVVVPSATTKGQERERPPEPTRERRGAVSLWTTDEP